MKDLPQKEYFNSPEVHQLLDIKPHELRYWESEFSQIRSSKTKSGKRFYRHEDVILLSAIKHFLVDKKFTISSIKKILEESKQPADILPQAALMHEEQDNSFDQQTHEIYQACSDALEAVKPEELKPAQLGELIADSIAVSAQNNQQEYDKALATLITSKIALTELLLSLDKFDGPKFYPATLE